MIYWLFILALIVEIFLYVKIYNDALGVAV